MDRFREITGVVTGAVGGVRSGAHMRPGAGAKPGAGARAGTGAEGGTSGGSWSGESVRAGRHPRDPLAGPIRGRIRGPGGGGHGGPAAGAAMSTGGVGRNLARAGAIVTSAFFFARLLGWVRLVIISSIFGAGPELDSFFAAFRIPDLIYQLVAAGAISSALIPVVSGLLATHEDERAWRVISIVTNLMMLILLALAVGFAIAAPIIVPIITPGFDAVQMARTVELSRIMLVSPALLALGSVATSILNSKNRFAASAIAPLLYNVATIVGTIILVPFLGVEGLALAVVAGSLVHLGVQRMPVMNVGFRYEPVVDLRDRLARQALLLMAPRALGLGVVELSGVIATTLASGLATGSISAYTIAFSILEIPIGVIGVPLGVVTLPTMARELATGSVHRFTALLTRALRILIFVMMPISALGMVMRNEVVGLLFNFGRFNVEAIELTSTTLFFFLIGMTTEAMIAILARAFYAGRDTKTPVFAAIGAVLVNVAFSVATVGTLGLTGLALGLSVASVLEAGALLWILNRRVPGIDLRGLGRALLLSGAASIVAAAVTLAVNSGLLALLGGEWSKPLILVRLIIGAAAGFGAYGAIAALLRVPELEAVREIFLLRILPKLRRIAAKLQKARRQA